MTQYSNYLPGPRGTGTCTCDEMGAVSCGIWAECTPKDLQSHILEEFSETTSHIALGCKTCVCTEVDSDPWWYSGLPEQLWNKLNGRATTGSLPVATFVALDASDPDRYYVQFADGHAQWFGPDSLSKALKEEDQEVLLVCFAPGNGWYVLWEDGTQEWEGLPKGLHDCINGRQKTLPRVHSMSCGQSGEWFVRFVDGDWRVAGHSDELKRTISQVHGDEDAVVLIEFGSDDNWVLVYT